MNEAGTDINAMDGQPEGASPLAAQTDFPQFMGHQIRAHEGGVLATKRFGGCVRWARRGRALAGVAVR
ncbi:hypothetical protein [Streptomyces sp. JJ38]|uniref:hypothetical protein n=1 Tax=Streptomyces sp. JJ38 TaxID=2738128 RepID=UPI001C579529|nr:hypothetical protein [Streptomyces sp. JJ38]MBW1596695.1 hypothetical protein [Streptomyces sp. JJ38]